MKKTFEDFEYSDTFIKRAMGHGGFCDGCKRPIISKSTKCKKCRTKDCKECGKSFQSDDRSVCSICMIKRTRRARQW